MGRVVARLGPSSQRAHALGPPRLRYFATHVGEIITLYTGEVEDEGWFELRTIPNSWVTAGPTDDGVRNYFGDPGIPAPFDVGPGLGWDSDPEALLDEIPDLTPMREAELEAMIGRRICAVVYDSDISINYEPVNGSLKGANLGTVAFEVLAVNQLFGFSPSSLPEVEIRILDAGEVCEGELELFTDAPEPISSSEPFDVVP